MTARGRNVLRWVCLLGQAATIAIAWPLWQDRTEPPLLPAVALPAFSFGLLLLASLALAAVRLGELRGLGATLPPVPRILRAWFAANAPPGDRLILVDNRSLAELAGPRERIVSREERSP